MTCKEYKDRALLRYYMLYAGSVAIAMNRWLRKTLSRVLRRLWLIFVKLLSARHQRVWHAVRSINVGIHVMGIEDKAIVYRVSMKNVQPPTPKHLREWMETNIVQCAMWSHYLPRPVLWAAVVIYSTWSAWRSDMRSNGLPHVSSLTFVSVPFAKSGYQSILIVSSTSPHKNSRLCMRRFRRWHSIDSNLKSCRKQMRN